MLFKPSILISVSPNTQNDDVFRVLKMLFSPWKWIKGKWNEKVLHYFNSIYPRFTFFTYNSGRSALYEILKAFTIEKGDEVLVQAFTCVAVPNAVCWTGAKPIFCDIDTTFNIDPKSIESRITKKTKAIIVQHAFGIPAQIEHIKSLAVKHNLVFIEDCAQGLGATVNGNPVGSFGDACIFSFGRDKIISSVWGGVAGITKSNSRALNQLAKKYNAIEFPTKKWTLQQLFHPIITHPAVALYNTIAIGKIIMFIALKLKLLSLPVETIEKNGVKPSNYPQKLPNALACMAYFQLLKLEIHNNHRKVIASMYGNTNHEAVYLRYPQFVDNPRLILQKLRMHNIYAGTWYRHIIDPKGVDLTTVSYQMGSCPNAEYAAEHIVNLPTHIKVSKEKAREIKLLLNSKHRNWETAKLGN